MQQSYTAVIQQSNGWWIGWVQEIPGVNGKERTKDELLVALIITLRETIAYIGKKLSGQQKVNMRK